MNLDDVERLIRLVAETDLTEVELRRAGVHLRIARAPGAVHVSQQSWHPAPVAMTSAPMAAAPQATPAAAPDAPAKEEEGLHVITATMVGTFYRRPNPESAPFVREGEAVRKGQVICILEAMKILNEIECDVSGTLVKIHAEDAQPVEFGEKLFSIRVS